MTACERVRGVKLKGTTAVATDSTAFLVGFGQRGKMYRTQIYIYFAFFLSHDTDMATPSIHSSSAPPMCMCHHGWPRRDHVEKRVDTASRKKKRNTRNKRTNHVIKKNIHVQKYPCRKLNLTSRQALAICFFFSYHILQLAATST